MCVSVCKKSSTNFCLKIDLTFKSEHDYEILIQFRLHSDFEFRKHELLKLSYAVPSALCAYSVYQNKRRTKKNIANIWRKKKRDDVVVQPYKWVFSELRDNWVVDSMWKPVQDHHTFLVSIRNWNFHFVQIKYFEHFEAAVVPTTYHTNWMHLQLL